MSVDDPGVSAAFALRWHLPFPLVSDPGGDRYLRPLGLWNGESYGGVGVPALLVIAPDGREVYRYVSRDFADRPDDDDLLEALRSLGLFPIDLPAWEPEVELADSPDAFPTGEFKTYFGAALEIARALSTRMTDERDRAEAEATARMALSFLQAWAKRERAG